MSTTTTVTVQGMSCGHCVKSVQTELGKIDGVTDVRADLETGAVTITSVTGVDAAAVASAVDDAGYELAP